jgi:peptidoglycan/LPS O-acetylase OafA/YrhL
MTSARSYPPVIASLTSLRFFAAIWVVALHYSQWPVGWGALPIIVQGNLAVDFFFVLSGFILAHAHIRQIATDTLGAGPFIAKRLARIYPLHLVTLIFYVLLVVSLMIAGIRLPNPERYDPAQILPNLLLVHAWQTVDHGAWNYPSWSISAEWFAYLLFPLLAAGIFRRLARVPSRWLVVGALAWLIASVACSPHLLGHGYFDLHSDFGYVRIMPEFVLGMTLYRFGREHDLAALAAPGVFALIVAAVLVLAWQALPLATVMALALLILSAAERARHGREGVLRAGWLIYLGEVSYALYMVHLPVATLLLRGIRFEDGSTPAWLVPIGMVVAIPVAIAAHHAVEIPGQRLVLRLARRSGPSLAESAPRSRG